MDLEQIFVIVSIDGTRQFSTTQKTKRDPNLHPRRLCAVSRRRGGPTTTDQTSMQEVSNNSLSEALITKQPIEEQDSTIPQATNQEANEQSIANDDSGDDVMLSHQPTASSWWLAIEERRKQSRRRQQPSRSKWVAVLLGQIIALVASSMNAASFTLAYHSKVDTQLFQLFIMYLFLSLHLLFRERQVVATE